MESRRERRCVIGRVGVVAVVSNLLASVLCMAPANAVVPVDEILGPLVICTEHGSQTVPNGAVPLGSEGQRDGKSTHCTVCTLLAGLALAVTLVFAAVAFPVRVFYAFKSAARTLADHLSLGGIRSRAPPLSV